MLVKFIPTGEVMDTNLAVFTPGPSTPARAPEVLDTDTTHIPYIGKRVSGTPMAIVGYTAQAYLSWRTKEDNQVLRRWKMNSVAAVTTAIDSLLANYTLTPDGSVSLTAAGVVTPI